MINILASLLGEKISISIENGDISIDSKNKDILGIINSVYSEALASYGPADGSFGGVMAQGLIGAGAKIIEITEPQPEENRVY